MNKAIRFASIFALILVTILLVNLTVVQGFRQDEYADNPLNSRNFYEIKEIDRGQISAGGIVLASSTADANGFYQRSYDNNQVAFSHITGYLSDIYGAAGIEDSYNRVLNGEEVSTQQWFQHLGDDKRVGNNVELTLIPSVQQLAYDQLVSNGYEGSVVALRPSTGEVLAMASTPGYDPNSLSDSATAEDSWAQLNAEDGNPLLNHATQETLPPGSIFKIITASAALQHGFSPSTLVTGASSITLPNTTTQLTNYDSTLCGPGGQVPLSTAFALSCNTAFAETGMAIGADALRDTADAFGIGQTYDLGLPSSPGSLGELADDASLAQSAIGQRDVTMSALQAAVMAATVANGGVRMEPHVVSQITAPDLSVVSTVKPKELNQAIPKEIADEVTELMRGSERNTSGYTGQDIASKTGTAEHGDGLAPHNWYVAFGPSENADVAVAVVVKNGGGHGLSATGGTVASPIGRAVLNAALQALGEGAGND